VQALRGELGAARERENELQTRYANLMLKRDQLVRGAAATAAQ
jgi:hypothetical protein